MICRLAGGRGGQQAQARREPRAQAAAHQGAPHQGAPGAHGGGVRRDVPRAHGALQAAGGQAPAEPPVPAAHAELPPGPGVAAEGQGGGERREQDAAADGAGGRQPLGFQDRHDARHDGGLQEPEAAAGRAHLAVHGRGEEVQRQPFLHPSADICVAAFQVVEISDVAEELAAQSAFVFAAPSAATTVSGKDLLATCTNGREPLFGNIVRLNVSRRRVGYVSIELPAIASSVHGGVKCEFRLTWDPLPKTKKMQRLARICDTKLKVEVDDMQNDESFMLAVPKRDIASAERKPCAGVGHDNIPHIYVMVMQDHQSQKGSSGRRSAFSELEMFPNEEPSRFEHHFTHVSGKKYGSHGSQGVEAVEGLMQEFDEMELSQEQPQEFYAPLLQRQYFHSRTGAVVLDHEKDYDSDDDVDETWITKQSERLLDEFEDVSLEEKEFMKKWNRHVKEFKILADFMVASSCRKFARDHGKWFVLAEPEAAPENGAKGEAQSKAEPEQTKGESEQAKVEAPTSATQ
ncbi:hypothetical protein ON010_g11593 [Phytophthora cinnamomi]|nr:hypothetical protein ON010_g11593 [Phytophthora cinnamomi]